MIGLIGKKIGMTQVFDEDGRITPVTVLQAGPCQVLEMKQIDKDGYQSIKLGYEPISEKKVNKPMMGYFKSVGCDPVRYIKEFRVKFFRDTELKDVFKVDLFQVNELVTVTGTSKGRGFAGVMKRHNFHGFMSSHGVHESFRGPGSIGMCATPARVLKGMKMAGHYGVDKVTVKNLKVVKIDVEKNLIMIKGAVPGHRNSLVLLKKGV
ncbi:50S ribosomal protein L3 [bacterium]|nr:50S ribosomal protein L3 [bacterium]